MPSQKLMMANELSSGRKFLQDQPEVTIMSSERDTSILPDKVEVDGGGQSNSSDVVNGSTLCFTINQQATEFGLPDEYAMSCSKYDPLHDRVNSLTVEKIFNFEGSSLVLVLSSAIRCRKIWLPRTNNSKRTEYHHAGRVYDIQAILPFLPFMRLDFKFSAEFGNRYLLPSIFNFGIKYLRVVPQNAAVMELARNGDIFSMEFLFRNGKADPSDILANGTSLLHVSLSIHESP